MRILAVIPARGGSKRLPGKNIKSLLGKPLINWTIDVAKEIKEISEIIVTTDDIETANIAKKNNAFVPWLRPNHLSTDYSSIVDVVIHAVDWYQNHVEKVDGVLLLQPTSPFRTVETIQKGIMLFIENKLKSVLSVSVAHPHPMWCVKIQKGVLRPYIDKNGFGVRSQDLPEVYALNGYLYLLSPEKLYSSKSVAPIGAIPLVIDSIKESLDIDTEWDWRIAECIA